MMDEDNDNNRDISWIWNVYCEFTGNFHIFGTISRTCLDSLVLFLWVIELTNDWIESKPKIKGKGATTFGVSFEIFSIGALNPFRVPVLWTQACWCLLAETCTGLILRIFLHFVGNNRVCIFGPLVSVFNFVAAVCPGAGAGVQREAFGVGGLSNNMHFQYAATIQGLGFTPMQLFPPRPGQPLPSWKELSWGLPSKSNKHISRLHQFLPYVLLGNPVGLDGGDWKWPKRKVNGLIRVKAIKVSQIYR